MRDIRADLEDRGQLLKDKIQSMQSAFEQQIETIQHEHENKLEELKTALDAVNTLIGSENRRLKGIQAPDAKSQKPSVQQVQPQNADLTDFIISELGKGGPASKDNLLKLAVRQGYVSDGDSAKRTFEEAFALLKKAGSIQKLPNGDFTLPTLAETIRLRRAG